jgi:hypothetical protein
MTAFIINTQLIQKQGTINPADDCAVLNKITPKAFTLSGLSLGNDVYEPECVAVQEIRGAVHFGHMFNQMCLAFLRKYFYSLWIFCVNIWVTYAQARFSAAPDLWDPEKQFPMWSHG